MQTAVKSQSRKRRRLLRRRFRLQWNTIGNLQSRDIAQKYCEEYSYDGLNRVTQARFANALSRAN